MKSGVLPVSHKVQEIYWLTPNTISGLGSWRVHLQPGHCGAMAHGLAKNLGGHMIEQPAHDERAAAEKALKSAVNAFVASACLATNHGLAGDLGLTLETALSCSAARISVKRWLRSTAASDGFLAQGSSVFLFFAQSGK